MLLACGQRTESPPVQEAWLDSTRLRTGRGGSAEPLPRTGMYGSTDGRINKAARVEP